MILLNQVSFSYKKGKNIISDLSLSLQPGTVCGLLGRNGVGKSTMLYLMCGLLRPSAGNVVCNGFNPFERKVDFLNNIFIVPEEFSLPPISISDFIKVNAPFYPQFSPEQMNRYLELFELDANANLGKLSMGQKKKAFLSFAFACNTNLLLLDEPTNGLDISSKRIFRQIVASAMTEFKTIVISTHQVYDVEKILDHVVIADNNSILLNSSMTDISSRLRFEFTNDPQRCQNALISLTAPGGANIVEYISDPNQETEVNLESLFELAQQRQDLIHKLFG